MTVDRSFLEPRPGRGGRPFAMFLDNGQRLRWGKPEWVLFAVIFGLLLLHPLLNGYPFLFPDSWGYFGACPDEMRSPVLGCALRPAVLAGGPWGYVVVQCAVTAFALAFLSGVVLERCYSLSLCLALVVSGVGIFAGWILADAWSLIGFICLFAMAAGHPSLGIAVLMAFACATHFGNFPVYAATAFLFLPWARAKARFAVKTGLCLLGAVVLVMAFNLIGGVIRFSSNNGYVFLASRILHDMPEVIDGKCQDDPGFALCERKAEVLEWSLTAHQSFSWQAIYQLGLSWEDLNRLSRQIVFYSVAEVTRFFIPHVRALARNTYALVSFYELSDGLDAFIKGSNAVDDLQACFPDDVGRYFKTSQASGALQGFLKIMERPLTALFWCCTFVCMVSVVLLRQRRRDDALLKLALFSLVAVCVNAFFMSNLSGVYGRYHTRIGFLVIFPGIALAFRWAGDLIERFGLSRNKQRA
jgi:hypothetical protein